MAIESLLGKAAKSLGKKLVEGVVTGIGTSASSAAFGVFLSAVGLDEDSTVEDMKQIRTELSEIKSEVVEIRNLLQTTVQQLQDIHATIKKNHIFDLWHDQHSSLAVHTATIKTTFKKYLTYTTPADDGSVPDISADVLSHFVDDFIFNSNGSIEMLAGQIHEGIMGMASVPGLLDKFTDILLIRLKTEKEYEIDRDSKAVYSKVLSTLSNELTLYYASFLYIQFYALTLTVEGNNFKNNKNEAQRNVESYIENLKDQEKVFFNCQWKILSPWVSGSDILYGVKWFHGDEIDWQEYFSYESHFDPRFQKTSPRSRFDFMSLRKNAPFNLYAKNNRVEPQEYLLNAETLVGNFLQIRKEHTRIVLHGAYFAALSSEEKDFTIQKDRRGNLSTRTDILGKVDELAESNTMLLKLSDSPEDPPAKLNIETYNFKGMYFRKFGRLFTTKADFSFRLMRQVIDFELDEDSQINTTAKTSKELGIQSHMALKKDILNNVHREEDFTHIIQWTPDTSLEFMSNQLNTSAPVEQGDLVIHAFSPFAPGRNALG